MKKQLFVIIMLILVTCLMADARQGSSNRPHPKYAPDMIKIKLHSDAITRTQLPTGMYAEATSFGINELDQLMTRSGGEKIIRAHRNVNDTAWQTRTGFDRWFLIKLDGKTSVEDAIKSFKNNRYIEDAIPEYYAYTTAVPNDTFYANNWGHNNTAQLPVYTGGSHSGAGVGTVGFDVDAQLAWDQSQGYGSASIIIAIIDTGVDTAHPDLRLVAGYDYGVGDNNPMDDSADPGHGTACSGVAAGRANNALGVTGVAGGCSVMPLKIADAAGDLGFTAIENAITHCGDNNVDVASMSFGAEGGMAEGDSPSTDAALEYAYSNGVTLLAATANSNTSAIAYPSNHNKVISVGAASPTGQRKSDTSSDGEYWWGSNYGTAVQDAALAVDICAPTILPATDITGAGNGYNTSSDYYLWFNGTSCATPYAAGVAALILSKDPTLTPAQVRTAMTTTATDMTLDGGVGWDRYTGYGMVNANAAINSLVPGLPSCTITSPASGSTFNLNGTITVNVTATDTDGTISQVQFFIDDSPAAAYTDYSAPYSWSWNTTGQTGGTHTIKAVATDNGSNTAESQISINLIAPADEGFETGNFSAYAWSNISTIPWTVQSSEKYSGTYAAKSGAIDHSGTTNLEVTLNVTSAGNISFFKNVSSETGYDFLRFYIDDVLQGSWSGAGSWTQQSYAVTAGPKKFRWTYSKDGSTVSGSDCAWIDHINFPPYTVYYAPPQNFNAAGGNAFVSLSWQAPSAGTPTGYKIYKNSSLLTTVTGLSYTDYAVSNGSTYTYYLKAVYSGGESDATASVDATPSDAVVTDVIIGTGTSSTGTTIASPINVYYESLHGQSVYTQAELNALGVFGPINITHLGFNITGLPTKTMPNFIVRMAHTTATNAVSWISTGLVTVYSNAAYLPTATGYNMYTLSTPFTWNGTDNIVIDTAFGQIGSWAQTGTVQYTTVTSGYIYIRNDDADQTSIFTGGYSSTYRPNVKLTVAAIPSEPEISVSTTSLAYGNVLIGSSSVQEFTITNTGSGTLSGSITTPSGYSVALQSAKNTSALKARNDSQSTRDVLPYSLGGGLSATYDVTFTPIAAVAYNDDITISHNAGGADKTISLTGAGISPQAVPFAEGFEDGIGNWNLVNGSQTNTWARGTATKHTGAYSLYISNDSGTSNAYDIASTSIAHVYRNISFPAGSESYKLRFAWKGQGEGASTYYDYLRVYLVDSTTTPVAGTALVSGQLGATYNLTADWQEVTLDIPAGVNGTNRRLVFTWRNDSSQGTQPPAAIDNIRIVAGEQSDAAVIIGDEVVITPPPAYDPVANPIAPVISITGLTGASGYITVTTGYASVGAPYETSGLDFIFAGANFAGATLNITHNLGYTPSQLAYKIGDGANWTVISNPGGWTDTAASFTVPSGGKGENDVFIVFNNSEEGTLPITLSSFTANLTGVCNVSLNWVTATETGVLGYYIYRALSDDLASAQKVSPLVQATNSSTEQSYTFTDEETEANLQYYYWLEGLDLDGGNGYYGPIGISTADDPDNPNPPAIPLLTELMGNYPNPFNPNTNLRYSLKEPAIVNFQIWNSRGQIVARFTQEHNTPGYYNLPFNGKDQSGRDLATGVYFCRMTVGNKVFNRKMLLMK